MLLKVCIYKAAPRRIACGMHRVSATILHHWTTALRHPHMHWVGSWSGLARPRYTKLEVRLRQIERFASTMH